MTETTDDSVSLKWEPPKNEKVTAALGYLIEKLGETDASFISSGKFYLQLYSMNTGFVTELIIFYRPHIFFEIVQLFSILDM